MVDEADYELVPVTPIRKLEKEVEALKGRMAGGGSDLTSHVIEVLKLNQKIVDELAMRESELIAKINETNSRLNELIENVAALTAVLSTAAEEEIPAEEFAPEGYEPERAPPQQEGGGEVGEKLDSIVEQNAALLNSLEVLGKELEKLSEK